VIRSLAITPSEPYGGCELFFEHFELFEDTFGAPAIICRFGLGKLAA
jgi:hypothetical protein